MNLGADASAIPRQSDVERPRTLGPGVFKNKTNGSSVSRLQFHIINNANKSIFRRLMLRIIIKGRRRHERHEAARRPLEIGGGEKVGLGPGRGR